MFISNGPFLKIFLIFIITIQLCLYGSPFLLLSNVTTLLGICITLTDSVKYKLIRLWSNFAKWCKCSQGRIRFEMAFQRFTTSVPSVLPISSIPKPLINLKENKINAWEIFVIVFMAFLFSTASYTKIVPKSLLNRSKEFIGITLIKSSKTTLK